MNDTRMLLKGLNDRADLQLDIRKEKMIIGSCHTTDLTIAEPEISSYHAFASIIDADHVLLKDLDSTHGLFLNGKRVQECVVQHGDTVAFGSLEFRVDIVANAAANAEKTTTPQDLVMIDGELCDIRFDDAGFAPLTQVKHFEHDRSFVEVDELSQPLDLVHSTKAKNLEVVSYVNGQVLDVTFLPLTDGDYFLSSEKKKKNDILFTSISGRVKLFTVKDQELTLVQNAQLAIPADVDLARATFFTLGTEQISLRLVDQSITYARPALLVRSKDFYQMTAAIFALLFVPFLTMLLVDFDKVKMEEASVAVVYKLPEPVVPKEDVPREEIASNMSETLSEAPKAKYQGEPQQTPIQGKPQMAANAPENKALPPQLAKMKASAGKGAGQGAVKGYSFKSGLALAVAAVDAPVLGKGGGNGKGKGDANGFSLTGNDKYSFVQRANLGVSKFNVGKGSKAGLGGYGATGLSNKSGFDSSYVEPKVVQASSMDPELVRKILREYIPQFRHCYQQELITKSDAAKGILDLNFRINANGKVMKHAIAMKDARFSKKGTDCVGRVLSLIDFPRPKGGGVVDIRQPLSFYSERGQI